MRKDLLRRGILKRHLLQPCPFCTGRTFEVYNYGSADRPDDPDRYVIQCGTCGTEGPLAATEADALKLWDVCLIKEVTQCT